MTSLSADSDGDGSQNTSMPLSTEAAPHVMHANDTLPLSMSGIQLAHAYQVKLHPQHRSSMLRVSTESTTSADSQSSTNSTDSDVDAVIGRPANAFNVEMWDEDYEISEPSVGSTLSAADAIASEDDSSKKNCNRLPPLLHVSTLTEKELPKSNKSLRSPKRRPNLKPAPSLPVAELYAPQPPSALSARLTGRANEKASLNTTRSPRNANAQIHCATHADDITGSKLRSSSRASLTAWAVTTSSTKSDSDFELNSDDEDWDASIDANVSALKLPFDSRSSFFLKGLSMTDPLGGQHHRSASTSLTLQRSSSFNEISVAERQLRYLRDDEKLSSTLLSNRKQPLSHRRLHVVFYPSTPHLATLKLPEGLAALNEQAFEMFLDQYVTKYASFVLPTIGRRPAHYVYEDWDLKLQISKEKLPEILWRSLSLANQLYRSSAQFSEGHSEAFELIHYTFHYLDSRAFDASIVPFHNDETCFQRVFGLLYIAAKLWKQSNTKIFASFIQLSKQIFPAYSGHLDLMEAKTVAHHDGSHANIVIRLFCLHYLTPDTDSDFEQHTILQRLRLDALVSLHLYLAGLSPLTTSPLKDAAVCDFDLPEFEWLDHAWRGDIPTTPHDTDLEITTWRLCGSTETRIATLTSLYESVSDIDMIKSRGAFVLAQHWFSQASLSDLGRTEQERCLNVAEQLAFESLFVLDEFSKHISLPSSIELSPALSACKFLQNEPAVASCDRNVSSSMQGMPFIPALSELATNVLVVFGDILLALDKYRYSIAAFESAAVSFRLLQQLDSYTVFEKLAELTYEKNDIERCIQYHSKLMQHSFHEGNLTVYLYITQHIARLEAMLGHFRSGEGTLRSALTLLHGAAKHAASNKTEKSPGQSVFATASVDELRSASSSIFQSLASLYMEGNRNENAVAILEMLHRTESSAGKLLAINISLVQAYISVMRLDDALKLLSTLRIDNGCRTVDRHSMSRDSNADVYDIKFRLLYYSHSYSQALQLVTDCIDACHSDKLGPLAKWHLRRGKILSALYNRSLLSSDLTDYEPDLASEALAAVRAYLTAYNFCWKIGDTVRMAKVVHRIVDIYLCTAMQFIFIRKQSPARMHEWVISMDLCNSSTAPDDAFEYLLQQVDELLDESFVFACAAYHLKMMLASYLQIAELTLLRGDPAQSLIYWQEANSSFCALFVHPQKGFGTPKRSPGWLHFISNITRRMAQLLRFYSPDIQREYADTFTFCAQADALLNKLSSPVTRSLNQTSNDCSSDSNCIDGADFFEPVDQHLDRVGFVLLEMRNAVRQYSAGDLTLKKLNEYNKRSLRRCARSPT